MGRAGPRIAVLLGAIALGSCSPQQTAEPVAQEQASPAAQDTHPVSGLAIVPVAVQSATGAHVFAAELADTPQLQAQGLMHRTQLGPNEAMLFPNEKPTARSFWMKNTPIPLDIIFIGLDGRISNIAAMTEPYSLEQVYSVGSTSTVLEIAGGRAAELCISEGDTVTW